MMAIKPISKTKKITAAAAVVTLIGYITAVEGGYVNNPNDKGGETNHGITKAVAVANGYTAPMKDMHISVAQDIYKKQYLEKPNYMSIMQLSYAVTHKLLDAGVNVGTSRVNKWFQESLNDLSLNGANYPMIKVDGVLGNGTINAYNALVKQRGYVVACQMMLKMLDNKQMTHYLSLNSNKMMTFRHGWIINRINTIEADECNTEVIDFGKK